jgi:fucose permease
MPRAFFGNNAASANLGVMFFPLGGLVAGGLAPIVFQKLEIRRALSLLAGVCLVPAFIVTLTPAEAFRIVPDSGEPSPVWGSSLIWLLCLGFLLYSPLEGSLGSWTTTYLSQLGFTERRAGHLMVGFWFAFVASRLGAAYFEYHYVHQGEPWVMITLGCLTAVGIGGLAGTHERRHAILWLLLIGLALGPIFPNLVGILYHHFGETEIGTAYGTMILLGGAGGLVFPPVMSAYVDRKSLRVALRLPTVISILLAGGSLALALSQ